MASFKLDVELRHKHNYQWSYWELWFTIFCQHWKSIISLLTRIKIHSWYCLHNVGPSEVESSDSWESSSRIKALIRALRQERKESNVFSKCLWISGSKFSEISLLIISKDFFTSLANVSDCIEQRHPFRNCLRTIAETSWIDWQVFSKSLEGFNSAILELRRFKTHGLMKFVLKVIYNNMKTIFSTKNVHEKERDWEICQFFQNKNFSKQKTSRNQAKPQNRLIWWAH